MTKVEARELLARLPRALDATPQISALRQQVADLSHRMSGQGTQAITGPAASSEVVDVTARRVLEGVITQFEALDERLRRIETVIRTLEHVAELKAEAA
jgi:hypothetical protein